MSDDKTGGAAFPASVSAAASGDVWTSQQVGGGGMSLLDWFAGKIAVGATSSECEEGGIFPDVETFAGFCYSRAEAMLAEKRRREKGDDDE